MAGALVGGAFLSATLQVLFDRLAHREVLDYLQRKEFNQDLLKKLKKKLGSVNAVLNDAEEKQISIPAVREWLDELEDAAYHADDLLDEIAADALRYKLEPESTTGTSSMVSNMGSLISHNSYVSNIESRMKEILKRLKSIAKQIGFLGLKVKEGVGENRSRRSPTTSLVDESEVFGRDEDKNAIIKLLLTDDDESGKKVSVIPIVGMGGVGKTTLAKLVYNDDKVEKHFMLKSWVCVSEEFDICKVTKTILAALTPSDSYNDIRNLDLLQTRLKKELAGKKFLIVLDDIWNENYNDWKELSMPFNHGAQSQGSKIIVTTRNKNVADIMSTVPTHYHLQHLKDEDCWNLFAKHAFDNIRDCSARQVLETIGNEIVEKCNGLPLAAKTLGGLLRSKEDVRDWEKILKSEIWDFSDNESKILPVLMLSYHYLPSHIKRCFAFCSIFPKGYELKKHELTLLWMAENLLQKSKNKRMEDVGEEYFSELVSRSFFQRSSSAENSCVFMHDLVHDLARYVSRGYCFTLLDDVNSEEVVTKKVRHLGVLIITCHKRLESIFRASHLRTFLDLYDKGFPFYHLSNELVNEVVMKLKSLRVLSFHSCYNLVQLSESIGELKHLRYLDLSSTCIIRLPESIIMLYNLEVLNLSDCEYLTELPKDMHHLVSLRHLDISYTNIVEPIDIYKLKSLQTLSTFIVGKKNGVKIVELGELSNLHGRLAIQNLQYVASAKDASEAKLTEKKYLEELKLCWNGDTDDSKHEKDVLDKLFPHTNLMRLSIKRYGGTAFSNWLGDGSVLCNILFLNLSDCKFCTCLPPIGQLPSLKNLEIAGLEGIVSVGAEFYYGMNDINGSCMIRKAFASLEFLSFDKMSNWEEWRIVEVEDGEVFPKLQELKITDCDRLISIDLSHNLPCLRKLRIDGKEVVVSSLPRTPVLRDLSLGCRCEKLELQELPQTTENISIGRRYCTADPNSIEIWDCEKVEFPLHHSLRRPTIERVEIRNSCGSLEYFPLDFFCNLRKLRIEGCKNLESLTVTMSDDMNIYIPLLELRIYECPNFMSFPNGGLHAPNLTHLSIKGCQKLKKLPEQMSNLLPSLNSLEISNCPEVDSFPHEGGLPFNLAQLIVGGCEKLKSLPEQMHNLLPSLNSLEIFDWPEVEESFPEVGLPPNLAQLKVGGCKRLKALPEQMFNLLSCLKELWIRGCPEVESFPEVGLPSINLTRLEVSGCKKLKVLPKQMHNHLPSLNFLEISDCPEVESFPEGGLPLNLCELRIFNCSKLFAQRMKWNLQTLPALKCFEIEDKGGIISESFPEEGLLPSTLIVLNIFELESLKRLEVGLQQLTSLKLLLIQHCPQLQEFPQQGLPTSLEILMIQRCPQLQKLPQQGLPTSLTSLEIYGCPVLEERCQWEQGQDWNKIFHIPHIQIHESIPLTSSVNHQILGISRFVRKFHN